MFFPTLFIAAASSLPSAPPRERGIGDFLSVSSRKFNNSAPFVLEPGFTFPQRYSTSSSSLDYHVLPERSHIAQSGLFVIPNFFTLVVLSTFLEFLDLPTHLVDPLRVLTTPGPSF